MIASATHDFYEVKHVLYAIAFLLKEVISAIYVLLILMFSVAYDFCSIGAVNSPSLDSTIPS